MAEIFSWLHLSDIHFGHGDADYSNNQKAVLRALREHIQKTIRGKIDIDAIFVTGDIAFSGNAEQYVEARLRLLDIAGLVNLNPNRIFLVPGNHDIDRAVDKDHDTSALVQELRAGERKLSEALQKKISHEQLRARMGEFLKFAADFAPVDWLSDPPLSWRRELEKDGAKIRLFGLNTALLCADDEDRGKLQVGLRWASELVAPLDSKTSHINIILTHHPFHGGWLRDEEEANRWANRYAQIHLMGHVNQAESHALVTGQGPALIRIVSGAGHCDPKEPPYHAYSFARIEKKSDQTVVIKLYPYLWSDVNKRFELDTKRCNDQQCAEIMITPRRYDSQRPRQKNRVGTVKRASTVLVIDPGAGQSNKPTPISETGPAARLLRAGSAGPQLPDPMIVEKGTRPLTGEEHRDFRDALISAFPTLSALEQLVKFGLDKNIHALASGDDLREIAFKLIARAETEGWTNELIAAAVAENPRNPALKQFVKHHSPISLGAEAPVSQLGQDPSAAPPSPSSPTEARGDIRPAGADGATWNSPPAVGTPLAESLAPVEVDGSASFIPQPAPLPSARAELVPSLARASGTRLESAAVHAPEQNLLESPASGIGASHDPIVGQGRERHGHEDAHSDRAREVRPTRWNVALAMVTVCALSGLLWTTFAQTLYATTSLDRPVSCWVALAMLTSLVVVLIVGYIALRTIHGRSANKLRELLRRVLMRPVPWAIMLTVSVALLGLLFWHPLPSPLAVSASLVSVESGEGPSGLMRINDQSVTIVRSAITGENFILRPKLETKFADKDKIEWRWKVPPEIDRLNKPNLDYAIINTAPKPEMVEVLVDIRATDRMLMWPNVESIHLRICVTPKELQ